MMRTKFTVPVLCIYGVFSPTNTFEDTFRTKQVCKKTRIRNVFWTTWGRNGRIVRLTFEMQIRLLLIPSFREY